MQTQTTSNGSNGRHAINWMAAAKSGLIVGSLFLILPLGIPWASLDFSSGAVMGRSFGPAAGIHAGAIILHLGLSVLYATVIACGLWRLRSWYAVLLGGVFGLVLYLFNFAATSMIAPSLTGGEGRTLFTHFVFGLFSAAAYLGLSRR